MQLTKQCGLGGLVSASALEELRALLEAMVCNHHQRASFPDRRHSGPATDVDAPDQQGRPVRQDHLNGASPSVGIQTHLNANHVNCRTSCNKDLQRATHAVPLHVKEGRRAPNLQQEGPSDRGLPAQRDSSRDLTDRTING